MNKWQEEFLTLLRDYYQAQKKKNPRFSMRALAQQLEIAPGPTSALIKGSKIWNISPEWALSVVEKMNLKPVQKNRMFFLLGRQPKLQTKVIEKLDGLALTHWAYWPVLCYFELTAKEIAEEYIALKLGISEEEVKSIISDQIRSGYLQRLSDGRIQRCFEALETTNEISSETIRALHKSNLEIALTALNKVPVQSREFQTMTLAGSEKALAEIKAEIRAFTEKVNWILNKDKDNDQVYRFSIQLFPVNFGDFK